MKYKLKDSSELGKNIRIYHGIDKKFDTKLQISLLVSNIILMTSKPYRNSDELIMLLSLITSLTMIGNASLSFADKKNQINAKNNLLRLNELLKEKNINIDILNRCIYNYFPDGEMYLFGDGSSIVYFDDKYTYERENKIIDITEDVNKTLTKTKKGKQNK